MSEDERHERRGQRERNEQHERYDDEQHAGNGTVNHGPDNPGGPDGLGGGLDHIDGLDGRLDGTDDLGADELALRRMLHEAVQEIEPGDGTLEHLRRAVPARRARKRQAVVGMAAAALFIGTAIPALVHVSNSDGSADDRTSMAGQAQEAHGGTSAGKNPDGGAKDAHKPSSHSTSTDKGGKKGKKGGKGRGSGGGGATGGPDPAGTAAASSPPCTASELGNASAQVGSPDAEGKVYGSFRITNISGGNCTIDGPGLVGASAQGAADPAKINVVDHTTGDAAGGLPDPSQNVSQLILQPGMAYEVRFAWVPSETCPTTGGSGDPSPDPSPTEGATDSGGTTDQGGTTTQLGPEDGTQADGSVLVSHTAEGGAPGVSTTIGNACAGTVYRTGVLAAS